MDDQLLTEIAAELRSKLTGRFVGKVLQLTRLSLAIDFGLRGGEFLFMSVEPSSPRFYLIKRRLKELEKTALPQSHFAQLLRAKIGGSKLVDIEKLPTDRIVLLSFEPMDDTHDGEASTLIAQLTGRSANLLLTNHQDRIIEALRPTRGEGQQRGETYQTPPLQPHGQHSQHPLPVDNDSPSAAADRYFTEIDHARAFDERVRRVRGRLRQSLSQKQKLQKNLEHDLLAQGDPELHKRMGDLLLANVGTAIRKGPIVEVIDYYAEGSPRIAIEIDENSSIQEEATRRFRLYTKAKRGREEIVERLGRLQTEIEEIQQQQKELDSIIETHDESALASIDPEPGPSRKQGRKPAGSARIPGVRHYVSSDGYELLVGRAARDNDHLTFRIARPNDLWLHAADYPGSHVVVRNPTRKEIPQRTMLEAAQLAGKFSQASEDAKVVVHYTYRKFLSKPKGAAPGLVRMSNFRSITVEPKEGVTRVR